MQCGDEMRKKGEKTNRIDDNIHTNAQNRRNKESAVQKQIVNPEE